MILIFIIIWLIIGCISMFLVLPEYNNTLVHNKTIYIIYITVLIIGGAFTAFYAYKNLRQ